MSCFLWVEDFAFGEETRDIKGTTEKLFGGIYPSDTFHEDERDLKDSLKKNKIFLELTFQDAIIFINTRLNDVDYIILDIDLPTYGQVDEIDKSVLSILQEFEGYIPSDDADDESRQVAACNQLKKNAGFYLYSKLVFELGFPKQHIRFFSNHGNEAKSIETSFKSAKIYPPEIYLKSDDGIGKWVSDCVNNPYSRLRRGIIEGCQHLKTLSEDKLRFKEFVKDPEKKPSLEDLHDYLDVLEQFLPLSINENKDSNTLYKLFIRILAHEWEAADPKQLNSQNELFAFSWIMKMTRNWLAHSKVFEQLSPQDVAFLFIVNMRAMFDLGDDLLPYEKHLLSLFANVISADEMTNRVGDNPKKRNDKNPTGRNIPLVENYVFLLKATGNTWQAINYHDALNNLQKNKDKLSDSELLIKGLYQTFWFLTSSGGVYIPPNDEKIKDFAALNYQFKYFDYKKTGYIFELARHIYNTSFLDAHV